MSQRLILSGSSTALILAWLLPHHYAPWMTAFQDALAIMSILILALYFSLRDRLYFPPIVPVFFFVLLIPLIQAWTGLVWFWGDAWISFIYLSSFCLAFLVGYNAADARQGPQRLLDWLFASLIIGAILSLILATRQWLYQPAGVWGIDIVGRRPSGNMAQPNNFASLLCMAVCGALYFYERRVIGKAVTALLVVVLLFGIALAQSRTSWVVALFFLGFMAYAGRAIRFRTRFGAAVLGVGLFACFVASLPLVSEGLLLTSPDLLDRVKQAQRLELYQMFTAAILQGGVWGYGWTQVALAQLAVAPDYLLGLRASQTHNLLLDIILWNGPILGAGIIVALGIWIFRLCSRLRTPSAFFALMAFFCLLIHGMLEYPLEYAFFLMPAGLLLGRVSSEFEKPLASMPRWLGVAMVLTVALLGGRAIYEYVQLENEYRQVRLESVKVIPKEENRVLPQVLVVDQIEAMVKVFRMEVRPGLSSAELDFIGKTAHRYPNHYLLNFYALNLVENGCVDMAYQQLVLIRALYGNKEYEMSREQVESRLGISPRDQRYSCPIR